MGAPGRSISHGLAGVPRSPEEARAFLQGRIRLVCGIIWSLSFAFFAVSHGIQAIAFARDALLLEQDVAHLVATAVPFAVWLACRLRPWSIGALAVLDAAGTIAAGVGFAWMGSVASPALDDATFPMILATTHLCFTRAVLVPSAAPRTLWIHFLTFLPGVIGRYLQVHAVRPDLAMLASVYVAMWGAIALVVTVITSRALYGLRERVRATMQLGQYTLDEKIGEGGMGIVYRASHAMLRRPTAIKLLPAEKAGEHNLVRFEREVQITSRLTHPNTVAIYDFGRTPDGVFYYAMEFLDGVTLEQLVGERGPQPPARVIHLLRQISGALAEAHEAGLIHRDIKPANVILCERGGILDAVKVLDFGLVKELKDKPEEKSSEKLAATAGLTNANTLMGTPLYMSPEAIVAPDTVAAASDLYALGAVGYFLLTGKTAFSGTTLVQALANQLHGELVPPSKRAGIEVPAELEALIVQCLAKEPADRPRSARDLEAALARVAETHRWGREEARGWWPLRGSSAPPPPASGEVSLAQRSTVAVDLRTRGVEVEDAM